MLLLQVKLQQEESKRKESSYFEEEKNKAEKENQLLRDQLEQSQQDKQNMQSQLEQLQKQLQEANDSLKKTAPITPLNKSPSLSIAEQPVNKPIPSITSPELLLRNGIIKMVGDKEAGDKLLVDLLSNKVLMKFKEKEALFCAGLPLPSFVTFRILMHEQDLNSSILLMYSVESMDNVLKVCKTKLLFSIATVLPIVIFPLLLIAPCYIIFHRYPYIMAIFRCVPSGFPTLLPFCIWFYSKRNKLKILRAITTIIATTTTLFPPRIRDK